MAFWNAANGQHLISPRSVHFGDAPKWSVKHPTRLAARKTGICHISVARFCCEPSP